MAPPALKRGAHRLAIRSVVRSQITAPLLVGRWGLVSPRREWASLPAKKFSSNRVLRKADGDDQIIDTESARVPRDIWPTNNTDGPPDDGGMQAMLALIAEKSTCPEFRESRWGFPIYRCTEGNDAAWNKMLRTIHESTNSDLEYYQREDLIKCHDLHVIDDKSLYGATSHEVRDHFLQWVPYELNSRLKSSAPSQGPSHFSAEWARASSTARYEFCLFVDDMCLESLVHRSHHGPVVKVLNKDWGNLTTEERKYTIHPDYHDGATDDEFEEVGWMYLPIDRYLDWYDLLSERKDDWWRFYNRPPYFDWMESKDNVVGWWRNK